MNVLDAEEGDSDIDTDLDEGAKKKLKEKLKLQKEMWNKDGSGERGFKKKILGKSIHMDLIF